MKNRFKQTPLVKGLIGYGIGRNLFVTSIITWLFATEDIVMLAICGGTVDAFFMYWKFIMNFLMLFVPFSIYGTMRAEKAEEAWLRQPDLKPGLRIE